MPKGPQGQKRPAQKLPRAVGAIALLTGASAIGASVPTCAMADIIYFREHSAWCAEHRYDSNTSGGLCENREWCDGHWNDDRISRLACDPVRSHADTSLPRITVSTSSLTDGRDLTW